MIAIENRYLPHLIPFLEGLPLKGSQSRARSKLLAMTAAAYQGLAASERELVAEYATCDETGEPLISGDATFTLKDPGQGPTYVAEREKLLSERTILAGDTFEGHLDTLNALLTNLDVELTGDDAAVYDHLCDAIETAINPAHDH